MKEEVFIFLGSKTMDHSRQFENHQLGLIKNLYENKIINFKNVIMSVYVPGKINKAEELNIKQKTERMNDLARKYSFHLDIIYAPDKTFINLFETLRQIKKRTSQFSNRIIFAQNYYSGYMGFRLKKQLNNAYFHTNLRGVPAEEVLKYSNSFFLRRLLNFFVLKWMEKKIILGSDSLSVVSLHYKKYLQNKIKGGSKHIIVYPCVYNSDQFYVDNLLRKSYRDKFEIQKHQKVFIYSGSMNKYQMTGEILRFYENISNQDSGKNCVFVFLTPDKEKAKHLSKSYKIHNLFIESLYDKDLLGIYNASDIGVICRKNDIVNRVASPTKIAEYLAAGNCIILTDGIGDYSEQLKNKKFAIVKKNITDFLKTDLTELMKLNKPDKNDLEWIKKNYSNGRIKIFNEIFPHKKKAFYEYGF